MVLNEVFRIFLVEKMTLKQRLLESELIILARVKCIKQTNLKNIKLRKMLRQFMHSLMPFIRSLQILLNNMGTYNYVKSIRMHTHDKH